MAPSSAYYSALSSQNTYYSARSSGSGATQREGLQQYDTEYYKLLKTKKLWPVNQSVEQNWSGKGQHIEFKKEERKAVDEILQVQEVLGSTSSAIVESVRCRRILLARKTVRCSRRLSKMQAIDEVAHLSKLNHCHIVRVIGTYVMGNDLSILIYPVAEFDLETFLQEYSEPQEMSPVEWLERELSLWTFPSCLSHAVEYIHKNLTKHMDIKPKNILVRRMPGFSVTKYKVYIADFGIARSYTTAEATETEGPTMFTRKYAAPEVVDREKRGLSADIFSLGCVFIEIFTTLALTYRGTFDEAIRISKSDQYPRHKLQNVLESNENGDTSYQANIAAVRELVSSLQVPRIWWNHTGRSILKRMIDQTPAHRPPAEDLGVSFGGSLACCAMGNDPLEAT